MQERQVSGNRLDSDRRFQRLWSEEPKESIIRR
jgi:hypothetical protein